MSNYDEMVRAIDEVFENDEVEAIEDPMERLKAYAHIAKNLEPEKQATEIRLRAEREGMRMMGRRPYRRRGK